MISPIGETMTEPPRVIIVSFDRSGERVDEEQ